MKTKFLLSTYLLLLLCSFKPAGSSVDAVRAPEIYVAEVAWSGSQGVAYLTIPEKWGSITRLIPQPPYYVLVDIGLTNNITFYIDKQKWINAGSPTYHYGEIETLRTDGLYDIIPYSIKFQ
ncbi:MAG: hypothetical protein LUF85_15495 [Bacteroides sp.]|nr:hypothetical protein [Bacteroides sp.]